LAERRSPKPQVGGSIPSWPATDRGKPAKTTFFAGVPKAP
jgi:hypothetical protein